MRSDFSREILHPLMVATFTRSAWHLCPFNQEDSGASHRYKRWITRNKIESVFMSVKGNNDYCPTHSRKTGRPI